MTYFYAYFRSLRGWGGVKKKKVPAERKTPSSITLKPPNPQSPPAFCERLISSEGLTVQLKSALTTQIHTFWQPRTRLFGKRICRLLWVHGSVFCRRVSSVVDPRFAVPRTSRKKKEKKPVASAEVFSDVWLTLDTCYCIFDAGLWQRWTLVSVRSKDSGDLCVLIHGRRAVIEVLNRQVIEQCWLLCSRWELSQYV